MEENQSTSLRFVIAVSEVWLLEFEFNGMDTPCFTEPHNIACNKVAGCVYP